LIRKDVCHCNENKERIGKFAKTTILMTDLIKKTLQKDDPEMKTTLRDN